MTLIRCATVGCNVWLVVPDVPGRYRHADHEPVLVVGVV